MKSCLFKRTLIVLGFILGLNQAWGAEDATYLLINIDSISSMTSYELVFTNVDTDETTVIRKSGGRGRFTVGNVASILNPVSPGRYYLSGVNAVYDQDTQPVSRLRDSGDYIEVREHAINYPGDVLISIDDRRGRNQLVVSFEARSSTLLSAVRADEDLFRAYPVFISIAGNEPMAVDPGLLGL